MLAVGAGRALARSTSASPGGGPSEHATQPTPDVQPIPRLRRDAGPARRRARRPRSAASRRSFERRRPTTSARCARLVNGVPAGPPGRRRRSGRSCGSRSRRSRPPRTRCATRWRCGRTASTGRTSAPPGSTSTSSCTSGTPSIIAAGSWVHPDGRGGRPAGYALSILRPRYAPVLYGAGPGHDVRAGRRAARAALPDRARHAVHRTLEPRQHLLGRLPAGRRQRLQRRAGQAVLRQPAARDHRRRPRGRLPATSGCSGAIVLPMSRPILGVVSVFAVLAAWKDFIWPLVVLPDPAKQPLSVRLPRLANVDRARRHASPRC